MVIFVLWIKGKEIWQKRDVDYYKNLMEDYRYLNDLQGIRLTRWRGLSEQIDHYLYMIQDGHKLSKQQADHLEELAKTISVFGKAGADYAEDAMKEVKKARGISVRSAAKGMSIG